MCDDSIMIRTHIITCDLPKAAADALNRASGAVYTRTLVTHYRIYRKRGQKKRHWLSMYAAKRLNDYFTRDEPPLLHAHSKDAAQEGFYQACKTARANRAEGARYPHKRKYWRTTVWKSSSIRRQGDALVLSMAKGQQPISIPLPTSLEHVLRLLEVRLVWDRCAQRYRWHLVVENGKQPKDARGASTVAVDLGEIHPAAASDGQTAIVVSCRELRAKRQYTAKRLAELQSRQSRCRRKSRRFLRLQKVKNRFRAKQQRRLRDMEHKISRSVVEYAVERQAGVFALGDVRDIADAPGNGRKQNQRLSTWRHGKLRTYLTYKAEAEGMTVVLIDEQHTSQTYPNPTCNHRHKPQGRIYRCPACGFQAHRDVVGAANILSRQLHGEVGKVRPPPTTMYRHPFLTGKRSGLDTGQPGKAESREQKAENELFQLSTLCSLLSSAVACDEQEAARF
jgi:putative transposase